MWRDFYVDSDGNVGNSSDSDEEEWHDASDSDQWTEWRCGVESDSTRERDWTRSTIQIRATYWRSAGVGRTVEREVRKKGQVERRRQGSGHTRRALMMSTKRGGLNSYNGRS